MAGGGGKGRDELTDSKEGEDQRYSWGVLLHPPLPWLCPSPPSLSPLSPPSLLPSPAAHHSDVSMDM